MGKKMSVMGYLLMFLGMVLVGCLKEEVKEESKIVVKGLYFSENENNYVLFNKKDLLGIDLLIKGDISEKEIKSPQGYLTLFNKTNEGLNVSVSSESALKSKEELMVLPKKNLEIIVKEELSVDQLMQSSLKVTRSVGSEQLLGDFDNNGIVDINDYKIFSTNYYSNDMKFDIAPAKLGLKPGWENIFAIKQGDGKINMLDFTVFISNYLKTKPIEDDKKEDEDEKEEEIVKDENLDTFKAFSEYEEPKQVFKKDFTGIDEVSGIVSSYQNKNVFWVHNDGSDSKLYAFNKQGKLLRTIKLGKKTRDFEDLTLGKINGKEYIFVGDFGDNGKNRKDYKIIRIPEPKVSENDSYKWIEVKEDDLDIYEFEYPDGKSKNCEAFAVHPNGNLYLIEKYKTGNDNFFKFPRLEKGKKLKLQKLGTFDLPNGFITGAEIHRNGKKLIIRKYDEIYEYNNENANNFDNIFQAKSNEIKGPNERQGEAICYDPYSGSIYTMSEGDDQVLFELKGKGSSSSENEEDEEVEEEIAEGLSQEAEKAKNNGFEIKNDSTASNGKFVLSKVTESGKHNENYKVVFKYSVEKSGKYKVKARVSSKGATSGANSFYIKVNGSNVKEFHFKRSSSWIYAESDIYSISKGTTEVVFYQRERNACLDKVELELISSEDKEEEDKDAEEEDKDSSGKDDNVDSYDDVEKYDLSKLDEDDDEHPGIQNDGSFPLSKGFKVVGKNSPWNIIIGKDGGPLNEYKQKYEINRGVAQWDNDEGGLLWRPRYVWVDDDGNQVEDGTGKRKLVNRNMTVWRKLPQKLYFSKNDKSSVKIKMMWKMDTKAIPEDDQPEEDYKFDFDSQENVLRGLRGTGDFRLCLLEGIFDSSGNVNTNVYSGKTMSYWPGYQVRFNPFVHEKFADWTGKNDNSNASHWYRNKPATPTFPGIADDWCQTSKYENHAGWSKIETDTGKKFPLASHAPFDEWFPVVVSITRRVSGGNYYYQSTFKVYNDEHELKEYKFEHDEDEVLSGELDIDVEAKDMKKLDYVDVLAMSFTNIRPYGTVHIKIDEMYSDGSGSIIEDDKDDKDEEIDEEEDKDEGDSGNTNVKGLVVEAEHASLKGFKISNDSKASGGKYIYGEKRQDKADSDYRAEFEFNVSEKGNYKIAAFTASPSSGSNSFFVKINGNPDDGYLYDTPKNGDFSVDYVKARDASKPVIVTLEKGKNKIEFYVREENTKLDKVELVKTSEKVNAEKPKIDWKARVDFDKSDLGLDNIQNVETIELYHGEKTKELGSFTHHSHIEYHNDLLVAAWSTHWNDEDSPGMYVRYSVSKDLGKTWTNTHSKNAVLFPPLEEPLQNSDRKHELKDEKWKCDDGPHYGICPLGYAKVDNKLYAIADGFQCINKPKVGRFAREVKSDGTLGPIFWINRDIMVPKANKEAYKDQTDPKYNSIREKIIRYLQDPKHMPQWDMYGFKQLDGQSKPGGEPTYAYELNDGTYIRYFRTKSKYNEVQYSFDKGYSWSEKIKTNFRDTGSRTNAGKLPNGSAYIVNNPGDGRDPLVLSVAKDGLNFEQVSVINKQAPSRRYDGRAKVSGYQYPHTVVAGDYLFVQYTVNKEDVYLSKIPLQELYNLPKVGSGERSKSRENAKKANFVELNKDETEVEVPEDKEDEEEDKDEGDYGNTNGTGLVVEAEHADLSGFEIKDDGSASNNKYIFSNNESTSGANNSYKAVFKFKISKEGKYKVKARSSSKGESSGANSFYIKVSGNSTKEFHVKRTSGWEINEFGESYNLSQGIKEVIIYSREKKTCLDKVELVYVGDTSSDDDKDGTTVNVNQGQWYKSKSESVIRGLSGGGVHWSPVKKPTTIHRYFTPVKIKEGETITFSMKWESDGRDGSNKEFSNAANSDPTDQGKGISDKYLRLLAGTGDFRVGFFDSDKKGRE